MIRRAAVLSMLSLLAACSPSLPYDVVGSQSRLDQTLDAQAYKAVDTMLDHAPELLASRTPVVVGSLEDIRDVNTSTPFGNIVSEMIRSRLVQRGVKVVELRVRSSVLLERSTGELLLSRDRRAILPPPSVGVFVAGTYAVASTKIYVSLKTLSAADGHILAAADFVADRSMDANRLLGLDPYGR